jgi:hypothetical protein
MGTTRKKVVPPARKHGRHLHHDGHRRAIAMTIENIKATELIASEREVLEEDRKRWKRIGSGAHLDEWLAFGPGLAIRRRLALRLAHTNRPEGKNYIRSYNELLRDDGFDTADKKLVSSLTAIQWLNDDAARLNVLREIREQMTPGERSRLNSPISAKQRVLAELKVRAAQAEGGEVEALFPPSSPVRRLKDQVAELAREKAHLEEQLAAADAGSLFDLFKDTAADIGDVIVDKLSEHKAREIVKAITAGLAAKKKQRQAPAG